jgi:DNA-binding response OmpR family regulator
MSDLKVLVVDDDGPILKALTLRFRNSGFEVLCAKDAISAISIATQEKPNAAILDINLPGIDGFALAEKLREQIAHDLPIVFMSASRAQEILTNPALATAASFFEKPFDSKALVAEVRQLLSTTEGAQAVG